MSRGRNSPIQEPAHNLTERPALLHPAESLHAPSSKPVQSLLSSRASHARRMNCKLVLAWKENMRDMAGNFLAGPIFLNELPLMERGDAMQLEYLSLDGRRKLPFCGFHALLGRWLRWALLAMLALGWLAAMEGKRCLKCTWVLSSLLTGT